MRRYTLYLLLMLFFAIPARADEKLRTEKHTPVPEQKREIAEYEQRLAVNPDDMESLRGICGCFTVKGEFDDVLDYSLRLITAATANDSPEMLLSGYGFRAQAFLATGVPDSAKHYLALGYDLFKSRGRDSFSSMGAVTTIYNGLGIYSVSVEMDHRAAISYFLEGIEMAESAKGERDYILLASNLARVYYLRNDPAGLNYALEVHEYGRMHDDKHMIFSGAVASAQMYYLLGQTETSLKYAGEAMSMVEDFYDRTGVYNLYANVLLATGEEKEAVRHFEKALEHIADSDAASACYTYLSYGEYLLGKGRNTEAIDMLLKGIKLSKDKQNTVHRYNLYRSLSRAYANTGDYHNALSNYISYHEEADSIFNVERERSINELRVKYEAEKKEKEIQEQKINLLRESRKLQATVFVLMIIIVILGATYVLYRRKNKLYLQIVRQHQESVRKEQILYEHIEYLSGKLDSKAAIAEKYSVSSLSDEKENELFGRLENLMKTEKAYREKNLTKDRVAELIDSNRTYLSQVINKRTGMSFNHYINSYRIKEAIRILSSADNDIPLKALASDLGFSSLTTFYSLFQNEVGMPPSKYRENVIKLARKK